MTNIRPSKQDIINAIKKKNQSKMKSAKLTQNQLQEHVTRTNKQSNVDSPTSTNSLSLRTSTTNVRTNKPSIEPRVSNLVDNRCRYWVENRISQLLNSDNFTSRDGYTFSIDNDRSKSGLCFRFTKNGTTLAKIDSNGNFYCSNVFSNGTSLSTIANFINSISSDLSLYVKHAQLKNGTYIMDIDYIKTHKLDINDTRLTSTTDSNHVTTLTVDTDIARVNGDLDVNGEVEINDTRLTSTTDTNHVTTLTVDTDIARVNGELDINDSRLTSTTDSNHVTTLTVDTDIARVNGELEINDTRLTSTTDSNHVTTLTVDADIAELNANLTVNGEVDINDSRLTSTTDTNHVTTLTVDTDVARLNGNLTVNGELDINDSRLTSTTDSNHVTTLTVDTDVTKLNGSLDINSVSITSNSTNTLTIDGSLGLSGKLEVQPTNITNREGYNGDEWLIAGYDSPNQSSYIGLHSIGYDDQPMLLMNEYDGVKVYGLVAENLGPSDSSYNQYALTVNGSSILPTIYTNTINPHSNTTITCTATYFHQLNPNLTNGALMYSNQGKTDNTDESGLFEYYHAPTASDRYIKMSMSGRYGIRAQNDRLISELIHYFNNGVDISGATSYFRLTSGLYIYSPYVRQLNTGLSSGNGIYQYLGRDSTTNTLAYRTRYYYHSTEANRFAGIGLNGYEAIQMYKDKVMMLLDLNGTDADFTGDVTITGDLSVSGTTTYHDVINASTATITNDATVGGTTTLNVLTANDSTFKKLTVNDTDGIGDPFAIWSNSNSGCGGYIGKERDTDKCMVFHYDTPTNTFQIGIYGSAPDVIKISNSSIVFSKPLTATSGSFSSSLTVNGSNVITQADVWSSGNNWGVIPYTNASGYTEIGKYLYFYNSDAATSVGMTLYYTGTYCRIDKPIYVYETNSSSLAQFYSNKTTNYIYFGYNSYGTGQLRITTYYNSTATNCYVTMGLSGYDAIKMYTDRVTINFPLTCSTGTITQLTSTTGNITTVNSTTVNSTNGNITHVAAQNVKNLWNVSFYNDEDMCIDFKKLTTSYNDLARLCYSTSGTYNNCFSLDINKSHSIIVRVYSDGEGTGNTDYFTTIKHVITLLDGDGKTTLKDLLCDSLTVNSTNVDVANIAYTNVANNFTQAQTINNSNILTQANVWSSGNNWDVIPYTDANGYTRIGKYLYFYNTDSTTSVASVLSWNGSSFEFNKPIYMYETSSTTPLNIKTNQTSNYFDFGYNASNRYMRIYVYAPSTLASRYIDMGLQGYYAIRMYYNNINLNYATYCASTLGVGGATSCSGNLTVSGSTNLQATTTTTLTSSGLITGSNGLTISSGWTELQDTNINADTLRLKAGTMNPNTVCGFLFGNDNPYANGGGELSYTHQTDFQQQTVDLCLHGVYCGLSITRSKTSSLTTFEAPKLETTNSTPANAIGSNLQTAILDLVFKEMYPVGSIYTTSTTPTSMPNVTISYPNNPTCILHGCTFQLLPSAHFIRNCSWGWTSSGGSTVFTVQDNDSPGTTSGNGGHTHLITGNTESHILTINEIPSHNHNYYTGYGNRINSNPDTPVINRNETYGLWHSTESRGGGQGHTHGLSLYTDYQKHEPRNLHLWMWMRTV